MEIHYFAEDKNKKDNCFNSSSPKEQTTVSSAKFQFFFSSKLYHIENLKTRGQTL